MRANSRMFLNSFLKVYYEFINFYAYCANCISSCYNQARIWAFDGKVIYKACYSPSTGYVELYNYNTFWATVAACLYKGLIWSENPALETFENIIMIHKHINIVQFIDNGVIYSKIIPVEYREREEESSGGEEEIKPILETPKMPKLIYAMINDKYNITSEYDLFKKSLEESGYILTAYELSFILFNYQRKSDVACSFSFEKLCCFTDNTFNEYVFKANDKVLFK